MSFERRLVDRARLDDLELIMELEESGFDPREQWSEASWRQELLGADRWVFVARSGDGGLLGVITCQLVGDTADLHRVVVASGSRQRGVATALVGQALRALIPAGATQLILEVAGDNAIALRLYRKLGFVELSRRRGYYPGGQDALVLRLALAAPSEGGR